MSLVEPELNPINLPQRRLTRSVRLFVPEMMTGRRSTRMTPVLDEKQVEQRPSRTRSPKRSRQSTRVSPRRGRTGHRLLGRLDSIESPEHTASEEDHDFQADLGFDFGRTSDPLDIGGDSFCGTICSTRAMGIEGVGEDAPLMTPTREDLSGDATPVYGASSGVKPTVADMFLMPELIEPSGPACGSATLPVDDQVVFGDDTGHPMAPQIASFDAYLEEYDPDDILSYPVAPGAPLRIFENELVERAVSHFEEIPPVEGVSLLMEVPPMDRQLQVAEELPGFGVEVDPAMETETGYSDDMDVPEPFLEGQHDELTEGWSQDETSPTASRDPAHKLGSRKELSALSPTPLCAELATASRGDRTPRPLSSDLTPAWFPKLLSAQRADLEGRSKRTRKLPATNPRVPPGLCVTEKLYTDLDEMGSEFEDPPLPDDVLQQVSSDLMRNLIGPEGADWLSEDIAEDFAALYTFLLLAVTKVPKQPGGLMLGNATELFELPPEEQARQVQKETEEPTDELDGRLRQVAILVDACKDPVKLWATDLETLIDDFTKRDFQDGNGFIEAATFLQMLAFFWAKRADSVHEFTLSVAGALRTYTDELMGKKSSEEAAAKRRRKAVDEIEDHELAYVAASVLAAKRKVNRSRDPHTLGPECLYRYFLVEAPTLTERRQPDDQYSYLRFLSEFAMVASPFLEYPDTASFIRRAFRSVAAEREWKQKEDAKRGVELNEEGRPKSPDGRKLLATPFQNPRLERLTGKLALERMSRGAEKRGFAKQLIEENISRMMEEESKRNETIAMRPKDKMEIDGDHENDDVRTGMASAEEDLEPVEHFTHQGQTVVLPSLPVRKGSRASRPCVPTPLRSFNRFSYYTALLKKQADAADELSGEVLRCEKEDRKTRVDFHPDIWPKCLVHDENRNALWTWTAEENLSPSAVLAHDLTLKRVPAEPTPRVLQSNGKMPVRIVVDAFEKEILRVGPPQEGEVDKIKKPKKQKENLTQKRVSRFMSKIEKAVQQDWKKAEMDFAAYAQGVLNLFSKEDFGKRVGGRNDVPFDYLCSEWDWGPENFHYSEISRIFITTLNLASTGNVELQPPKSRKEGEDSEPGKCFGLTLRSTKLRKDVLARLSGFSLPHAES